MTQIPMVDVTQPNWETVLDINSGSKFFCLPRAAPYARKKLSAKLLEQVPSVEHLNEKTVDRDKVITNPVAARAGEILLSNQYHPGITTARVWLCTHHLELIKELLGNGYVIELLDQNNNVIRRLGDE